MKNTHTLVLVLGLVLAGIGLAQEAEITDAPGTIRVVNAANDWYAIVPDADRDTRYAPDRLPDDYKQDGLRVVFSGRVGKIEPNVRAWGTPFTLTAIRLASR